MNNERFENLKRNSVKDNTIKIKKGSSNCTGWVLRRIACLAVACAAVSNISYGYMTNQHEQNIESVVASSANVAEVTKEDTKPVVTKVVTEKDEKLAKMFEEMYKDASENPIADMNAYYEENYDELNADFTEKGMKYMYAANAYKKAHDKGISDKELSTELASLYEMQEIPRCMDEHDEMQVNNLISTLDNESLFGTYIDLAIMAHNLNCDKEHTRNLAGGISHVGEEPDFGKQYVLTK